MDPTIARNLWEKEVHLAKIAQNNFLGAHLFKMSKI